MSVEVAPARLRELVGIQDVYILPEDDFAGGALIPALCIAQRYDCMAGFFGSGAFRKLSHGLAEYIQRPTAPIRLLISPNVDEQDQQAMRAGLREPAQVLEARLRALVGDALVSESALERYTLECLA